MGCCAIDTAAHICFMAATRVVFGRSLTVACVTEARKSRKLRARVLTLLCIATETQGMMENVATMICLTPVAKRVKESQGTLAANYDAAVIYR
ncbi:hypothetical protein E2542_SST25966 [Spatholobus suberectus]|nr:hypothetical protein E2542_SST25966 [Spatholobus suberectus]